MHLKNLKEVLTRPERAGLRLKKDKCSFMVPSVTYLGYRVDAEGVHPVKEKVKAIQKAPALRKGLLNYYNKFLPNLSAQLAPLLKTTQIWKWTQTESIAFHASKDLLLSSQLLVHFDPNKELICRVTHQDMELEQYQLTECLTILKNPLGMYHGHFHQLKKEALACVFGVKCFHSYLQGQHFTLVTDHKPLLTLFNEKKAIPTQASARIQRWALTLATYGYSLTFKRTTQHSNDDALSRLPLPDTVKTQLPPEAILLLDFLDKSPVTSDQICTWTRQDPLLAKVMEYLRTEWPDHINDDNMKPFMLCHKELSFQDVCILWETE